MGTQCRNKYYNSLECLSSANGYNQGLAWILPCAMSQAALVPGTCAHRGGMGIEEACSGEMRTQIQPPHGNRRRSCLPVMELPGSEQTPGWGPGA